MCNTESVQGRIRTVNSADSIHITRVYLTLHGTIHKKIRTDTSIKQLSICQGSVRMMIEMHHHSQHTMGAFVFTLPVSVEPPTSVAVLVLFIYF